MENAASSPMQGFVRQHIQRMKFNDALESFNLLNKHCPEAGYDRHKTFPIPGIRSIFANVDHP